jgi:sec-independent protein translocase protein TatA
VSLPISMVDPSLPCAFFGGTSSGEIVVIFVLVLLLFGPRKLPEIARMIGKILGQLRNASGDFRDQIMNIEEEEVLNVKSVDLESDKADEADDEEGRGGDGTIAE